MEGLREVLATCSGDGASARGGASVNQDAACRVDFADRGARVSQQGTAAFDSLIPFIDTIVLYA
jgi:hypothetical protein